MINVERKYLKIIKDIVRKYIKDATLIAFGSRVNGENSPVNSKINLTEGDIVLSKII